MKLIFYYLIFATFYYGCNNGAATNHTSQSDSTQAKNDSAERHVSSKTDEQEDLNNTIEEFMKMCNKPEVIDSSFILDGDTVVISAKHYCLMDSLVTIPKKYVSLYKLDSFKTHNFTTLVTVKMNGKKVTEKIVMKTDFENYLDANLKEYGVLLYPEIRKQSDAIIIDYSISIPLTDVGTGVSAIIKKDGTIDYIKR